MSEFAASLLASIVVVFIERLVQRLLRSLFAPALA